MIGVFPGTFDFVHPGHIKAFKEARSECGYLVIALQIDASIRDGKNKPIFTPSERYWMIKPYADEIVPYSTEEELVDLLRFYSPCKRFLGADWKGRDFTGCDISGIENCFITRKHEWSSSNIRARL